MTAEGSAAEALAPSLERSGLESLAVSTVLGLCDKVVGEAGRRGHAFGWLRLPGAQAGEWLTVDAYYPVNRLVVVCRSEPQAHDQLIQELVPKHGLRLLELDPTALGGSRDFVETSLVRLIAGLDPPPHPVRATAAPARGRAPVASAAPARGRAPAASGAAPRGRTPAASGAAARALPMARAAAGETSSEQIPFGLLLGVALGAAIFVEVFVGVIQFGLDGGHLLVASGLALDASARALGTVAACQAGSPGWAWACALGGSPLVVSFASLQSDGPVDVDPAPLAGVVATGAVFVLFVAGAVAALGL